jgi:arginine/lysine/ornithine decarboxylase
MLEALADYHARDRYGFTPPGHRQDRGADPRAVTVIGQDAFRSDLLATAGLDDRKSSGGYLPGLRVLREEFPGTEASHDLDPLHVVIDVSELGVSGYDAADWLREQQRVDVGLSDHRRIEATPSVADDDQTADRLLAALRALASDATDLPRARPVALPGVTELEFEPTMLPRDAFFAAKQTVEADKAAGRICAEQITPYPPGIPVIIPGERITAELLDYLRTGLAAGHAATRSRRSQSRHHPGRIP